MTDMILKTLMVAGIFVVCYPVIMASILLYCKVTADKNKNGAMSAVPEAV